jgi:hypothetical protein
MARIYDPPIPRRSRRRRVRRLARRLTLQHEIPTYSHHPSSRSRRIRSRMLNYPFNALRMCASVAVHSVLPRRKLRLWYGPYHRLPGNSASEFRVRRHSGLTVAKILTRVERVSRRLVLFHGLRRRPRRKMAIIIQW